jgi:hypothetical protein
VGFVRVLHCVLRVCCSRLLFADVDKNAQLDFREFMKFASVNRHKMRIAQRDLDRSGSGNESIYKCFALSCCLCTLGASWIPYCVWKRNSEREQHDALKQSLIRQNSGVEKKES